MSKRLSRAEKWLLATPVIVVIFTGLFLAWKRSTTPFVLSTPQPPMLAQFLPAGKMLVVTQPLRREETFPTAVIYDWNSGKQLRSHNFSNQVIEYESHISPDGKYWLIGEQDRSYRNQKLTVRSLDSFEALQTFNGASGDWIDAKRFVLFKAEGSEIWNLGDGHHPVREQVLPAYPSPISPNGEWGIEYRSGKKVDILDTTSGNYPPSKSTFAPTYQNIVSLPDQKKRMQLPGTSWADLSWSQDSKQLFGITSLLNMWPIRADIMRFDIATGVTSSNQLEFPKQFSMGMSGMTFRFSPDRQILGGGFHNGSMLFWNADNGQLLKSFIDDSASYYPCTAEPQFSPDNKYALHLTRQGVEIYRRDQILRH